MNSITKSEYKERHELFVRLQNKYPGAMYGRGAAFGHVTVLPDNRILVITGSGDVYHNAVVMNGDEVVVLNEDGMRKLLR